MALEADAQRKGIDLHARMQAALRPSSSSSVYGQNWCGSLRPEQERLQVQTDGTRRRSFALKV